MFKDHAESEPSYVDNKRPKEEERLIKVNESRCTTDGK